MNATIISAAALKIDRDAMKATVRAKEQATAQEDPLATIAAEQLVKRKQRKQSKKAKGKQSKKAKGKLPRRTKADTDATSPEEGQELDDFPPAYRTKGPMCVFWNSAFVDSDYDAKHCLETLELCRVWDLGWIKGHRVWQGEPQVGIKFWGTDRKNMLSAPYFRAHFHSQAKTWTFDNEDSDDSDISEEALLSKLEWVSWAHVFQYEFELDSDTQCMPEAVQENINNLCAQYGNAPVLQKVTVVGAARQQPGRKKAGRRKKKKQRLSKTKE
jgi:hypothetical protein